MSTEFVGELKGRGRTKGAILPPTTPTGNLTAADELQDRKFSFRQSPLIRQPPRIAYLSVHLQHAVIVTLSFFTMSLRHYVAKEDWSMYQIFQYHSRF
ncbi:hypothetical protein KSP39_PZI014300 [Platanthera zijinensis]|uniref:Uncharacterized protein n=1 Tax=Platanthera zijinensis TaxID=2320716 RepID=A0AAP0G287_9ASPA